MDKLCVLLFFVSLASTLFSQVVITDKPDVGFEDRITSAVNDIRIIDTHEHLMTEEQRLKSKENLDFSSLFKHYAKEDLISASNKKGLVEMIYNSNFPLIDRWEILEPLYKATRSTGYGRVPLIAARDLYGISDINESTIEELSAKMREANKPGWYEYVLKEKARIELSIQDMGHNRFNKKNYRHVERFSQFALVSSGSEIRNFGLQYGMPVNSLADYLKILREAFVAGIKIGMVGVKT